MLSFFSSWNRAVEKYMQTFTHREKKKVRILSVFEFEMLVISLDGIMMLKGTL